MMNEAPKKIGRGQFILAAIGIAANVVVRFSYWISIGMIGSVGAYLAIRVFALEEISLNQEGQWDLALLGLAALVMVLFLSVAKGQQGTISQQMASTLQSNGI